MPLEDEDDKIPEDETTVAPNILDNIDQEILKEFDVLWRISNEQERPTRQILKDLLDLQEMKDLLSKDLKEALKDLVDLFTKQEAKRLEQKQEMYHVHGILSAWVTAKIILELKKNILRNLERRTSDLYNIMLSRFSSQKEASQHYFTILITAALLHDVGGIKEQGKSGASPNLPILTELIALNPSIPTHTQWGVLGVTWFTDYDAKHDDTPAQFKIPTGEFLFDADKITMEAAIVIVSDLLQIGAFDYKDRVEKDLGYPRDERPVALLLLLASTLHKLGGYLGVSKPLLLIPSEIRADALDVLLNTKEYWKFPPIPIKEPGKFTPTELYNPSADKPWIQSKEALAGHIAYLLGVTEADLIQYGLEEYIPLLRMEVKEVI